VEIVSWGFAASGGAREGKAGGGMIFTVELRALRLLVFTYKVRVHYDFIGYSYDNNIIIHTRPELYFTRPELYFTV
jgi:hypothetical protein